MSTPETSSVEQPSTPGDWRLPPLPGEAPDDLARRFALRMRVENRKGLTGLLAKLLDDIAGPEARAEVALRILRGNLGVDDAHTRALVIVGAHLGIVQQLRLEHLLDLHFGDGGWGLYRQMMMLAPPPAEFAARDLMILEHNRRAAIAAVCVGWESFRVTQAFVALLAAALREFVDGCPPQRRDPEEVRRAYQLRAKCLEMRVNAAWFAFARWEENDEVGVAPVGGKACEQFLGEERDRFLSWRRG